MKTRKKRSEELRADLWSILGPTGSALLLAALDNDNQACLALADYFEDQGDATRSQLARDAYPTQPKTRQDLGSLYDLLCTLPSLKTVCSQERTMRIDAIHLQRQLGKTVLRTGEQGMAWVPDIFEDPDGSIRDQYDIPLSQYQACCRLKHCTMLFERGISGWSVPFDVGKQVIEFRRRLRHCLQTRIEKFTQEF